MPRKAGPPFHNFLLLFCLACHHCFSSEPPPDSWDVFVVAVAAFFIVAFFFALAFFDATCLFVATEADAPARRFDADCVFDAAALVLFVPGVQLQLPEN